MEESIIKEHICEVCGKASFKKLSAEGKTVCRKHYDQYKKYGKFLDSNSRTVKDLNSIRIKGNVAYMDLYDVRGNVIATTQFDSEDIHKVQYTKWNLSANGYVQSRPGKNSSKVKHFHRVVLETDRFVDHIDGNKLNNHKSNLRICSKAENNCNKKNVKGITHTKNGKVCAYIKRDNKLIHLGTYIDEEEAQWARWYAERIVFKEFARKAEEPEILELRKKDIKEYIDRKVQRL